MGLAEAAGRFSRAEVATWAAFAWEILGAEVDEVGPVLDDRLAGGTHLDIFQFFVDSDYCVRQRVLTGLEDADWLERH